MTSWLDNAPRDRDRRDWVGSIAIACAVPVFFFGLYFGLDFLLQVIAGWIA